MNLLTEQDNCNNKSYSRVGRHSGIAIMRNARRCTEPLYPPDRVDPIFEVFMVGSGEEQSGSRAIYALNLLPSFGEKLRFGIRTLVVSSPYA